MREKIDAKAQWLAAKEGYGWKMLTKTEQDEFRTRVHNTWRDVPNA